MAKRQKSLGVTEYGYKRGYKEDEFLAGIEITKLWCGELCAEILHEYEVKRYWNGLTVIMPEHFYYTNTFRLDSLTVR